MCFLSLLPDASLSLLRHAASSSFFPSAADFHFKNKQSAVPRSPPPAPPSSRSCNLLQACTPLVLLWFSFLLHFTLSLFIKSLFSAFLFLLLPVTSYSSSSFFSRASSLPSAPHDFCSSRSSSSFLPSSSYVSWPPRLLVSCSPFWLSPSSSSLALLVFLFTLPLHSLTPSFFLDLLLFFFSLSSLLGPPLPPPPYDLSLFFSTLMELLLLFFFLLFPGPPLFLLPLMTFCFSPTFFSSTFPPSPSYISWPSYSSSLFSSFLLSSFWLS